MPRAEGWAILMLLRFVQGEVHSCADSFICARRFRKLRHLRTKAVKRFANPDLWLQVREHGRVAEPTSSGSMRAKQPQQTQACLTGLTQQQACETVRSLEFSFQHQQCVDYNRWLDARAWQLQGLLLERAIFWLQRREFPGRVQGPLSRQRNSNL